MPPKVFRYSDGTYLEDQDMWFLSGIYRDVYVHSEPENRIRDFFTRCSLDENYENAVFYLDAEVAGRAAAGRLGIRMTDLRAMRS